MQKTYYNLFICFLLAFSLLAAVQPVSAAQALPEGILSGILDYIKGLPVWPRIEYYLQKKVEERKPVVQQELNREIKEVGQDAIKQVPSLWQKITQILHKIGL